MRGLINLRGTLVTVVDLAVRFGAAGAAGRSRSSWRRRRGSRSACGVDEVRDVQALSGDALEEVDAQRAAGGIVRGLAHLGGALAETALIVDVAEIVRQALVL